MAREGAGDARPWRPSADRTARRDLARRSAGRAGERLGGELKSAQRWYSDILFKTSDLLGIRGDVLELVLVVAQALQAKIENRVCPSTAKLRRTAAFRVKTKG